MSTQGPGRRDAPLGKRDAASTGPARADDPMPVFTIKAKDKLAVRAVGAYLRLCQELGLDEQAAQVELAMAEIHAWRRRNPRLVQLPDHAHVPACADPRTAQAETTDTEETL